MYNITDELKNLFLNHNRQSVIIQVDTTNERLTLTEENIIQGSFTVDRYCVSGDMIEVGSAIAGEVKFKLDNWNGLYDDVVFEGSELYIRLGVRNGDKFDYIPIGYFTVDTSPRKKAIMEIAALDRMVRFDKVVGDDKSKFGTNRTVSAYVQQCCTICGVILKTDLSTLPNCDYIVPVFPDDDDITYRQLIQWCAAIMGTCAYIDWNGELRFEWYTDNETGVVITSAERYSSDIYENDISIKGIYRKDNEHGMSIIGDLTYGIDLSDNLLLQYPVNSSFFSNLYRRIGMFTYRPYSCVIKPMPYLYPLDMIVFVDKKGVRHSTIITHITVKMNGSTSIAGKGETATTNSQSTRKVTANAAAIISTIRSDVDTVKTEVDTVKTDVSTVENNLNTVESGLNSVKSEVDTVKTDIDNLQNDINTVSEREELILHLNETMSNAMGLYRTVQVDNNGATKYYYHNTESVKESSIIYTFNDGGFAWATGWNNGSPVWKYGVTSSGNAILNYLTVNKLNADHISVKDIVGAINESTGDSVLTITAEHLNLNGFISANGTFTVSEAGYMTATGGEIAGLIMESVTTQDVYGVTYNEKSIRTQNNNFNISVTTNENDGTSTSEVVISQLRADNIISPIGENEIDLSYTGNPVPVKVKILSMSYKYVGFNGRLSIYQVTVKYSISSTNASFFSLYRDKTLWTKAVVPNLDPIYEQFVSPIPNIKLTKGQSLGEHEVVGNVFTYGDGYLSECSVVFTDTNSAIYIYYDNFLDESFINIKGNIMPKTNATYNFGTEDNSFKNGFFQNLYANKIPVSAPYLSETKSVDVYVSRGDSMSSGWSNGGIASETVITCGNLKITTVIYEGNIAGDKWYLVHCSRYTKIYSVQISQRARSDTTLQGYSSSARLSVYWNDSNIFVGNDHDSGVGFVATIIGI